ncbi:hypothetical protein [Flavobacterium sp.]
MEIKNYVAAGCLLISNVLAVYSQTGNTFFGGESGVNSTGNFNSGYGVNSLQNNSSHSNSAFGFNTLSNTKGGYNSAFGNSALKLNASGAYNCAIGTRTLENNRSGSKNIAIGHRTLESNIFGDGNTSVGYASLLFSTGSDNIALGNLSGKSITTGNSNIFIGNGTGANLLNGNQNVFIGKVAVNNSPTTNFSAGYDLSRSIILADAAGNQRIFVSRAGNIGLGLGNNIIPVNKLDVNGGVVIGKNYVPSIMDTGGYTAPLNGMLVEGRVGFGNSNPKNQLEITHGTDGNSGLRFTNLTSNYVPTTTQTSDKFLSVNQNGDVVLQKMATSPITNALVSTGNTMTNTVNGNNSSTSIVNTISNSLSTNNQLITTVNGVASAPITLPIPNISEFDLSTTNEIQVLTVNGNTVSLSLGGGSFTLPTLIDTDTDQQTLALNGNVLSILNGNAVTLPTFTNTDSQNLTMSGNTISISGGNSITIPAVVDTNTDEQTIALNGNILSILNGNSVTLPTFTNTDSQNLTLNGNTISISGGNSITIPTVVDTNTDEQTLALNGNVLSILNGNSVTLPAHTDNDSQTLTLSGNTLSISGGNAITIPTPTFAVIPGTNTTISGNGSVATPFQINAVDTSLYANDGTINQATTTNNNRKVNLNNRNLWFDTTNSTANGKLYIGSTPDYTSTTGNYKLFVEGGIMTEKVKVSLRSSSNWADYVFEKDYNLMSLTEVEKFVNENKHLPGVQSAKELAENGIDIGEMQSKQMEKIEELTLYIIDQNKKLLQQNDEIQVLKSQMNELIQKMK